MRMALLVIAATALAGGVAQAQEQQARAATVTPAVDRQDPAAATKVLYVCSEDERNWRAFSRDLGTPDFVTAKQVLADEGKAWSAPKCITKSELHRLTEMAANNAR
ncbi:MAG: hypothetical protein GC203_04045 [Phenylobacterium sp.]|uniref:hypothetical protein n=1 Tax=Phenylobacterium sp. TaxID=1871053 RepID=UPI0025E436E0|nr:hypothetical protein [Phenylobacterium sp.]MBI1197013.1 hypothetical protein [Phenylobacterium sp.]